MVGGGGGGGGGGEEGVGGGGVFFVRNLHSYAIKAVGAANGTFKINVRVMESPHQR